MILVTGASGFIGSHLTDKLIKENDHHITIYDTLSKQVHGQLNKPPEYLNKQASFVKGSVTDYTTFEELVKRFLAKDEFINLDHETELLNI